MATARARPKVRVISASKLELKRSKLRADLCQRLTQGEIIGVPNLRQRREDIPGLIKTFTAQFAHAQHLDIGAVTFSADAIATLTAAPWEGEVRELRATVETLVDRASRGQAIIDIDAVNDRLLALQKSHGRDSTHAADFGDEEAEHRVPSTARCTVFDSGCSRLPIPLHTDSSPY